ncbi:MAG: RNA polymerase sigma factor [Bacteroidia bacterium]|nr:RNA polymerase sigma factor [Bacteroidia bacterium]
MKTKLSWANLSDIELVHILQQGECRAFDMLMHRHHTYLRSVAKKILLDAASVDDLLQEGMLKIYQQVISGKYADDGRFLSWASRIIRNLAIDKYRNQKSKQHLWGNEDLLVAQKAIHSDSMPEEQLMYQELAETISCLLNQLPKSQREVVHLRFFEELSFREIAEQTGTNLNTTLGRLRYALKKLRTLLDTKNAA